MKSDPKRYCLECGKILHGRSDKKFCNDICRSAYANKRYKTTHSEIFRIHRILLRNHHLLEEYLQNGFSQISVRELYLRGFNFDYFTSIHTERSRHIEICCFDIRYIILNNDVKIWR